MLRAVTFDLWGTLMMDRAEGMQWVKEERIRRIGEVLGNEHIFRNPEAIRRAYSIQGDQLAKLWATLRDIGTREQIDILLQVLDIGHPTSWPDSLMDRLIDAYTAPILSQLPVPIEGASDVLSALERRGIRLGLICNTGRTPGKTLRIILERLGLAKHFSKQTFSDELGLRKPHPEIFRQTLTALGVRPPEALHVGDTLTSDIVGAQAVGVRSAHFSRLRGADPRPEDSETIFSLTEILALID